MSDDYPARGGTRGTKTSGHRRSAGRQGGNASSRGVDFQKTITIDAPLDTVVKSWKYDTLPLFMFVCSMYVRAAAGDSLTGKSPGRWSGHLRRVSVTAAQGALT